MIFRVLSITLLFTAATDVTIGRELRDCYANDLNPYFKFATKTAYEFAYERPKLKDHGIPDCEPIQLWVLARHGTRYPSRKDIRALAQLEDLKLEIIKNHEERKSGRLCYADLNSLKSWKFNVKMSDANLLTKQGFTDLYFLAKRLRTKYPVLFQQGYSPNLFQFRHTDSERTRQSAQAFAEGMFGGIQGMWIPPAVENDTVIKSYENCTYWINAVKNNPENQREAVLFRQTEDMRVLVHNVSLRLGFSYDLSFGTLHGSLQSCQPAAYARGNPNVPHKYLLVNTRTFQNNNSQRLEIILDTIDSIYDMCRYDKAWNVNERSAWCAAFTKKELRVLEYWEDIKAYYDSGYGDERNLRLGCTPLKDMFERFRRLEDENVQNVQEPVGVFYFTHSAMLLMTLSRLEVASHGFPLRHENYEEQENRDWRTSDISPFAGNLIAVFYKCRMGEFNRIMFFLNERRIDYEGCDVGLCSWSYIRNKFSDIPEKCNLDWCHNRGYSNKVFPAILLFSGFQYLFSKFRFL